MIELKHLIEELDKKVRKSSTKFKQYAEVEKEKVRNLEDQPRRAKSVPEWKK